MRIFLPGGELDLPADFSFEIEKTSSIFSENGEQSIPVTLPATSNNLVLLGQPLHPARYARYPYKIDNVCLEAGIFSRNGELVISKYSHKGISASFIFSESVIYSKYKETTLKELFKDTVRTTYSTPWEWAEYMIKVYNNTVNDNDFTLFQVLCEKNEENFLILNEPDTSSSLSMPRLVFKARTINVRGNDEKVPEGYGITPFLYLRRFVTMLFDKMGYAIGSNAFENAFFDKIVLVNNNADSICDGTLHYSDLVPSCTVAEWLEWMEMKFGIYLSVRSDGRTVDLVTLDDIYSKASDMELTGLVYGEDTEVSVSESAHLVVKSATSIDGAAPAAETWSELVERYGACFRLNDTDFMKWDSVLPATLRAKTLVYRLSAGEFYETASADDGSRTLKRLGTDYFARDGRSTDNQEERSAQDELPPMYDCVCGIKDNGDIVTALYIGNRLHSRTSVIGQSDDTNGQKIIIAADAGMSAISYGHAIRYRFGTIRGCDNQGNVLENIPDMRPEAMYNKFFVRADEVKRNCTASVKLVPHLQQRSLITFDMLRTKLWKGANLLPKTMTYTVGSRYECSSCDFLLLQQYSNAIPDKGQAVLPDLKYIWQYCTDEAGALERWLEEYEHPYGDPDSLNSYAWRWHEDAKDDFLWMPYPDKSGLKTLSHTRKGYVMYFDKYIGQMLSSELIDVDCWFESAEL